ncbi:MAG: peptide ABC transporter substrate-binding protein [Bdellovibrionaceae bacterium]|nr:peptide ABC transporter substrate-binding protein [Pseudobdellovibrionaceae bacterium]
MHQATEPGSLEPFRLKSSSSQFLLQNLHRNLFRYDDKARLVPDLAESCERSKDKKTLTCQLKPHLKWSDGTPLTNRDFLKSYERILDPATKAPRADLLFSISGAEDLYRTGKGRLGVSLKGEHSLRFELTRLDPDFEHNLSSLILAPYREGLSSGPYRIQKWEKGQRIRLTRNDSYPNGFRTRPDVEILFIEDDGVALKLFEKGDLHFLRRLPTLYIPKFKKSAEFHWIPLLRLDYLGFGPRLKDQGRLREALSLSLNYEELQRIFHSEGRPGCTGLPPDWIGTEAPLCHGFDPARAKEALKSVEMKKLAPLRMIYSNAGGEDHRRAAEWEQDQWKKNLGLNVQVRGTENKIFLSELRRSGPDLFRRGVGADRPTCRAFLETFKTTHPDNVSQVTDPDFQKTLENLDRATTEAEEKKFCSEALNHLMRNDEFIPLGQMHFAILASRKFSGWTLNSMLSLDLSELKTSTGH